MPFFSLKMFKPSAERTHKLSLEHTSLESKVYTLQKSHNMYNKGSKFLIKKNQFTWIVHEYVASKLYQYLLGEDKISNTALVYDQNKNQLMLATHLRDDFKTSFIPFNQNKDRSDVKAGSVSFSCAIKTSKKCKKLDGFAEAFIASRVLDEGDDSNGNNYALKKETTVTRYDFDDSLKFFDRYDVSPGTLEESLPGFTGLKLALTLSMQTRDDHMPRDISWKEFSVSKGSSHKKITFDKKAFFKAMETFISIDFVPLDDLITRSFEEVQSVVGDQGLLKHYNFEALHKKAGAAHQHETPAKQLALFAIDQIHSRLDKLKDMHTCLKAQLAVEDNTPELLENIVLYKNGIELQCQNPDDVVKATQKTFPICDFVQLQDNFASQKLAALCKVIETTDEL